ncbi:conjugal transfer protein TraH [Xanthomonas hortorum]|uniref:conjugal transfer protein TraH n=1 Tax=Xanthomonas hortorum TaxID=56454 RepID=UPI000CEDA2D1|nr:conjugal transfer protein TraH [Xanthomonas hortorum]MCE4369657.1 conjugal transfer protein TraH [Xanthomonas hortorum pv. hederae]PPU86200.1 conjugal transfer protein TraH [Xanthomonas hortorum pv. hederae]PUF01263.1 conjugal transfer protein TraH [Xanthomonas hortorum pv. hederae]
MALPALRRTLVTALGTGLCLFALALPLRAGDLNAEVNAMFDELGAIGNYTAPGAFRGQAYNTYTGGSLIMRSPNKVYQLVAIQFPSARAGCGGIDVFGGSFSHISAEEFKNMLRNITAALPGIAFQLALEAVSPLLGGLTKWAKGLETWINNARINSCETAKAIVSSAADAVGYSSQETCADLAMQMGLESDRDAARRRCSSDRAGILATARASSDPHVRNKAPFVGNLTWKALQHASASLDDQERELIMSLVGTIIYYPEEANRDPTPVPPTLTSISQLLYGQAAAGDDVLQHLLRCNNYTDCDQVTVDTSYQHTPFTQRVETLMRSIADRIASRTPIPNPSPEVGFVNMTSEPVYKMLSIGSTIPGSGLTDSLIGQYRDVIAADYAYVFLERNLRVGMAALDKNYQLDQVQREQARQMRQSAQAMLLQIAQEKNLLYQKVGSFRAVSNHLEQLERQLRSNLPQQVMDMLGQQAAYLN